MADTAEAAPDAAAPAPAGVLDLGHRVSSQCQLLTLVQNDDIK